MTHSSKNDANWFDDDFEVTYEDDSSVRTDFDFSTTKLPKEKPAKKKAAGGSRRKGKVDLSIPTDISRSNNEYNDSYGNDYNSSYENDYDCVDDNSRDTHSDSRTSRKPQRRSRYRPTRLAAPLQKGGNAIYRVSQSLVRNLSLILIAAIIVLLTYNFYRGSAPYGDIQNAVSTQIYTQMLTAYFAVAAVLILYEVIALLWAATKVRVRDKYGSYREDVGRGLYSFVFIYVLSYLAFLLNRFIPESIDILKGIKGALDVFGSMHNALFGLCLAGVISCLVRKYGQF